MVVGEVKAGKSSLLNALFGREFCKVDVLPATDRIYEFKYGEKEYDVQISDHITALHRRIDFLKDFNIVDTPGTNTIVANHQEITENFVPMADLIVFVFAVTNPWAASAWDFLRSDRAQWKKNIVFVVQQADLRDPTRWRLSPSISIRRYCKFWERAVQFSRCLRKRHSWLKPRRMWIATNCGVKVTSANWKTGLPKLYHRVRIAAESCVRSRRRRKFLAGGLRARLQGSLDMLKSDQEKLASIREHLRIAERDKHKGRSEDLSGKSNKLTMRAGSGAKNY